MNIIKTAFQSFAALFVITLITGILYPLFVTAAGKLFSDKAEGSLVYIDGQLRGSKLLAQKFILEVYFWPRPSFVDYSTVASGASNFGPLSIALAKQIQERKNGLLRAHNGATPPDILLTASGSGLDPDITPEAAMYQIDRVANARKLSDTEVLELKKLIQSSITKRTFGFLGEDTINVLELNMNLDKKFPLKK